MTLEDRANLYRLIYDSVTIVGTMFKVTQGDKAAILDINGNEFISGDLDSLKTCDSFILLRKNGDTWNILNTLTGKRIKTKLYMYWDEDFRCIGSGLLGVKVDHMEYKLYDIYLNEILTSIRMFSGYSKNGKCIINYRLEYYSFGKFGVSSEIITAVYNYKALSFEKYGEYDLGKYGDYEYKAIATEKSKHGINKNGSALSIFRYKLTKNDNVRGDKTYENIYRTVDSLTGTFFVTEYYNVKHIEKVKYGNSTKDIEIAAGNNVLGVIDTEGNELIPPLATKVQYIGTDNFLLAIKSDDYDTIYNLKQGIIYDYELIDNITIHNVLPISIIRFRNGAYGAIDNKGNIFDIRDIAKYFKCSYNKNNTSIIKVELDYKTAYITNKLVPITNMTMINKYKKEEFIPMI